MKNLQYQFDNIGVEAMCAAAAAFGQDRYGYVVTPNVDHLIRLQEQPSLRPVYEAASFVTLDSRFLALLLRLVRGTRLQTCTGSDLTQQLLTRVVQPDDVLLLIGCSEIQAAELRYRHSLRDLRHHNPPMGFIHDPQAVEQCLDFIERQGSFRFCLLAVGSPQQEQLAWLLQQRGRARGLALCIGASVNFITGRERRAPQWMQRCGLEWLYRLVQDPRRLAHRYLVRGPRIFPLISRSLIAARPAAG